MGTAEARLAEMPTNTDADTAVRPSSAPVHLDEERAGETRVLPVPSSNADDPARPAEVEVSLVQGNRHTDKAVSAVEAQVHGSEEHNAEGSQDTETITALPKASLEVCQMFVLVHGICGSPGDMNVWKDRLQARSKDWCIHVACSITPLLSVWQQITGTETTLMTLAANLVEEIAPLIKEKEPMNLHFICHSLGGLIMRSALPALWDIFNGRRVAFGHILTLNSPHLGVKAATTIHGWKNLVRLTRLQSQCNLNDEHLFLEELADTSKPYFQSLTRFKHRTAVGATHWDIPVSFCSATISRDNPFPLPLGCTSFWRIDAAVGFTEARSKLLLGDPATGFADAKVVRKFTLDVESISPNPQASSSMQVNLNSMDISELRTRASDAGVVADSVADANNSPNPKDALINLIISHPVSPTRESSFLSSSGNGEGLQCTERMLFGVAAANWRRIAYTAHRIGRDVHTFSIGNVDFIERLIDMLEEDL